MTAAFVALALALPPRAAAQDCAAIKAQAKTELRQLYRFDGHRVIVSKVNKSLTPAESAELGDLSTRFKANQRIEDRIALQRRSRQLVRAAARRAGYRVINPDAPSREHPLDPFDAELPETASPDGSTTYGVEVRALLIMDDPRPHVTLWVRRSDPVHNARLVVSMGIMPEENDDYVSWMKEISPKKWARLSERIDAFLNAGLPASCLPAPAASEGARRRAAWGPRSLPAAARR